MLQEHFLDRRDLRIVPEDGLLKVVGDRRAQERRLSHPRHDALPQTRENAAGLREDFGVRPCRGDVNCGGAEQNGIGDFERKVFQLFPPPGGHGRSVAQEKGDIGAEL